MRALERPLVVVACMIVAGAALLIGGCSSSSGPSEPTGVRVDLGADRIQISRTVSVEATHTYGYRSDDDFNWYVNDIYGGNAMVGTITQTNPATYTAPPAEPSGGQVVIKAVSQESEELPGADTLQVLFTVKHVDVVHGSNSAGGGAWNNPLRTITYALDEIAEAGDTVLVHGGTYDHASGEDDLLYIPQNVTLRGVSADSCSLEVAVYVAPLTGSTFESFTMAVPRDGPPAHAIYTSSTCTIRDIHTTALYGNSAIRVYDDSTPLIEDCEIVNASGTVDGRGMELVFGTHAIVRNCEVSGWGYGIFANEDSDPLIEGCLISGNSIGVINYGGTPANTNADLGGGARGSAGGNTIQDNVEIGLKNQTALSIWALYNTWDNTPPVEGPPYPCDIENNGGGSVITQAP